jgi:large subunit ribosomal protein L22
MAAIAEGQFTATHRYARIAERKVRLVADMIRGMDCDQALEALRFEHKRAARFVEKVLKSAIASANEAEADVGALFIAESRVDPGPIIKRFRPKDRGRAHSIQKRTSHIVVGVAERD